jgi:hypothetical protein
VIATNHAPNDVDPGRDGSRGLTNAAYLVLVAAAGLIALWFGAARVESALAVTAAIWLALTLVLRPSWRVSGAALSACVMAVLLVRNFPELPLDARLWALACIVISLIGLRMVPVSTTPFFPFFQLYLGLQLVYVTTAVLVAVPPDIYKDIFTVEVRTAGFRLLTLATGVLVATAVILSRALWQRAETTVTEERPIRTDSAITRAWMLIVIAAVASVVISLLGLDASLGSLSTLVRLAGAGGGTLLALFWFRGTLPLIHRIGLVAVSAVIMITGLGSGELYQGALPGYLLLGLFVCTRRRIPWALLVLATAVLVLANLSKSEFRTDRRAATLEGNSAELGVNYLDRVIDDVSSNEDDSALANSAYRFANLSDQLGYYGTWVPDRYPHYGYDTYLNLPRVLVPRFLDPSKPDYDAANEVGRRYEIISPFDFETTVNPSPPAEAYVAGGTGFLIVASAGTGAFLVLLGYALRSRRLPAIVTGVLLAYQVVSALESGVLSMFLAIPFGVVLFPVMRWMAAELPVTAAARSPLSAPVRSQSS